MNKYCPSCGAKTFIETDEEDFDRGTEHSCLSCGAQYYLTLNDPMNFDVEPDPKYKYFPLYDTFEMFFSRTADFLAKQFLGHSEPLSAFNQEGHKGDTIKFRRYAPLNPPPEGTDQSQGDEK